MFRKLLTYITLGAVAAASIPVQAGTSIWKRDDPGSYMDGDTYVGGWNLNGATSEERLYTGPWVQCPTWSPAPCQNTHSEAHTVGWSFATAWMVQINAGIKDFGSVQASTTQTYTKINQTTWTDSATVSIPQGKTAQFVGYMPRRYGSASLKGVMVDTGRQETRHTTQCGPRGCHTTYYTVYYYEWQSGTYGGVVSGNKNTKTEPIWTWRMG